MIKISVDEGAAFDMLSIAMAKNGANPSAEASRLIDFIAAEIAGEIGVKEFGDVLESDEYTQLQNINIEIYKLIDSFKIKNELVDARIIDESNYRRYLAKKSIQEKFFNSTLTEKKFGYKND